MTIASLIQSIKLLPLSVMSKRYRVFCWSIIGLVFLFVSYFFFSWVQSCVNNEYSTVLSQQPPELSMPALIYYSGHQLVMNSIAITIVVLGSIIFVCIILASFALEIPTIWPERSKTSFDQLPENKASLFNSAISDPVHLCKTIETRIEHFRNQGNATLELALDFVYLTERGIVLPRKKGPYCSSFLNGIIGKSEFSARTKWVEDMIQIERKTPSFHKTITKKYQERNTIYQEYMPSSNTK